MSEPMPEASDDGQLAKQFADNYRSGAQGAEMDYESARLLAFSIDALARLREAAPAEEVGAETGGLVARLEAYVAGPDGKPLFEALELGQLIREAAAALSRLQAERERLGKGWAEAFAIAVGHQERADAAEQQVADLERGRDDARQAFDRYRADSLRDTLAAESQLAAAALRERAKDEALKAAFLALCDLPKENLSKKAFEAIEQVGHALAKADSIAALAQPTEEAPS